MSRTLDDVEIRALLAEPKTLPENWKARLKLRPKAEFKYDQRDLRIKGANGNIFKIVLRQNTVNRLDFSVILMFIDKDGSEFRLCRFNGNSHKHTNKLEKSLGRRDVSFSSQFHLHMATERYQQYGFEIDGYAEVTSSFSSFDQALDKFIEEYAFVFPEENLPLFDTQGGSK